MKKYMIVLVVGIILSLGCAAQAEMAIYTDVGLSSQYIGGDNGATVYNDAVLQGSVKFVYSPACWGLYSKLWGSTPRDWNADFGSEIDFVVGAFTSWKDFTFDLSFAYYDLYEVGGSRGDLSAFELITSFPEFKGIKPYLNIQGIIPVDRDILEGGMVYRGGFRYKLPELNGKVVNIDFSLSGHDGAVGKRPELVSSAKLSASMDFHAGNIIITPTLNFQKRIGYEPENGGMTEDRVWASINFGYAHLFE